MNWLHHFYPGAPVLEAALNVAVQVAGVVIVALVLTVTLARRDAAARHGIWLAALAWVCISPGAAWALQRTGIALWRSPPLADPSAAHVVQAGPTVALDDLPVARYAVAGPARSQNAGESAQTSLPAQSSVPPATMALPPSPSARAEPWYVPVVGGISLIWAIGVVILMIRLVRGLRKVAALCRAQTPAGEAVQAALADVRRVLGTDHLPAVGVCSHISGPATAGWMRPVVLLPAGLAEMLTRDELRDVLVHECAHARRHDFAVGVIQQIVGAVFWVHPMVYVLNKMLARAREEVCDNEVLRERSAPAYARTLLSLVEKSRSAGRGIMLVQLLDRRWRLEDRIAGLLNPGRTVMTRLNKRTGVMVAAVIIVAGSLLAAVRAAPPAGPAASSPTDAGNTEHAAAVAATTRPGGPQGDGSLPAGPLTPWVDPVEKKKHNQAERELRRAEMDVEEAEIKLRADRAPTGRDASALQASLDEIGLKRAQLALTEVKERLDTSIPPPPVEVTFRGGDVNKFYERYSMSRENVSLKDIAAQVCTESMKDGTWEVSLFTHDEMTSSLFQQEHVPGFNAMLDDVLAGKPAGPIVHPGDRVELCHDIVGVSMQEEQHGVPHSKVLLLGRLRGGAVSLQELLVDAGLKPEHLGNRPIDVFRGVNSWSTFFKSSSVGGQPVRPGDRIEIGPAGRGIPGSRLGPPRDAMQSEADGDRAKRSTVTVSTMTAPDERHTIWLGVPEGRMLTLPEVLKEASIVPEWADRRSAKIMREGQVVQTVPIGAPGGDASATTIKGGDSIVIGSVPSGNNP